MKILNLILNSRKNYQLRRKILVKGKVKNNGDMYSRLLTNIPQNFKTYENLLKQFQLPMQKKWGFLCKQP